MGILVGVGVFNVGETVAAFVGETIIVGVFFTLGVAEGVEVEVGTPGVGV